MPTVTKPELHRLILEALEELQSELEKKKEDDNEEDPRDFRKEPLVFTKGPHKGKSILFDDENAEEDNVNILELDATLEDGSPVCEGCLVAYMNEATSMLEEAKYHGRSVPLGRPMRGDVKKFKVFVRDPKTGNVKKINFGDKKMRIKKSNPKRRKSFRARHHCENPGPRTKARYWSCRAWE